MVPLIASTNILFAGSTNANNLIILHIRRFVNVQSTPEPDKTDTILEQLKQLNFSVSTMSVRVSALETQTKTSQTTAETVQQHNQATVDIVQPHVLGFQRYQKFKVEQ